VVAVLDERIIGVVQARTVSDDAWINVVMIDASWRHQGLGSAMLHRLEDKLLHLGVRKISALLSSAQAGETALLNRGFAPTHGLVLYEKLEQRVERLAKALNRKAHGTLLAATKVQLKNLTNFEISN
jgi:GNAT superfamily N-acetyltransferase